ncbi:hypothetical protein SDC9_162137 [bioreactor metagenome]|uniref:Uncharacterized protein n=1 Tax=bioreactor metagenome TaxID=1076179 RepID=A0A645FK85_9ZZZZ
MRAECRAEGGSQFRKGLADVAGDADAADIRYAEEDADDGSGYNADEHSAADFQNDEC